MWLYVGIVVVLMVALVGGYFYLAKVGDKFAGKWNIQSPNALLREDPLLGQSNAPISLARVPNKNTIQVASKKALMDMDVTKSTMSVVEAKIGGVAGSPSYHLIYDRSADSVLINASQNGQAIGDQHYTRILPQ